MSDLGDEIVQLVASYGRSMGISEIARDLDRPISTVYNWLTSERNKSLKRDDNKKWSLVDAPYEVTVWPLYSNESVMDPKIQKYIQNPLEHMTELAILIKKYREDADVASGRIAYIQRVMNVALNDRDIKPVKKLEVKKEVKREPTKVERAYEKYLKWTVGEKKLSFKDFQEAIKNYPEKELDNYLNLSYKDQPEYLLFRELIDKGASIEDTEDSFIEWYKSYVKPS